MASNESESAGHQGPVLTATVGVHRVPTRPNPPYSGSRGTALQPPSTRTQALVVLASCKPVSFQAGVNIVSAKTHKQKYDRVDHLSNGKLVNLHLEKDTLPEVTGLANNEELPGSSRPELHDLRATSSIVNFLTPLLA